MKLNNFLFITIVLSSCSRTYLTKDLKKKYQIRMETYAKVNVTDPDTGKQSRISKGEIFETYNVYMTSSEVKNEYEVLALYMHGFITKSGRTKKWLEAAMLKCASIGGNAIIIQSPLTCSLIIKEKKL